MLDRQTVRWGVLLGLLNNAVYLGLTFSALRTLRPEIVVVIVSCTPFLTTLFAALAGLERIEIARLAGIMLGFTGVVVMCGVASPGSAPPDPLGLALAACGTLAFAAGTVLFRGRAHGLAILPVNFWQSVTGAVVLAPVALAWGGPWPVPAMPTVLALLYLAAVATIGGMALWLLLIRSRGAAKASACHLLNPVSGVVLSHLVLGTALRPTDFAGAAIIALGLALTLRPSRTPSVRPAGAPAK
nr:DMT family transporter [Blastochloris tepida]